MKENIELMRRVELKYLLDKDKYEEIQKKLRNKIKQDKYHKYTIHNLYLDTSDNHLINSSLEKPLYKEKIRIRCYNTPKNEDYAYIEIKQKYADIVAKEREKIKLEKLFKYLYFGESINFKNKRIENALKTYKLKPFYIVSYDRLAYVGKNDNSFRLTFDQNLRSRKCNLDLESTNEESLYFNKENYIMEVKTINALPLWFVKILADLKIYPSSFSKIGNIYLKGVN